MANHESSTTCPPSPAPSPSCESTRHQDASPATSAGVPVVKTAGQGKKNTVDPCKPRRALSAYNFFFKLNRQQILNTTEVRAAGKPRRSHGKIGFAELARTIAARWNSATAEEKQFYEEKARLDKQRFTRETAEWKAKMLEQEKIQAQQEEAIEPEPLLHLVSTTTATEVEPSTTPYAITPPRLVSPKSSPREVCSLPLTTGAMMPTNGIVQQLPGQHNGVFAPCVGDLLPMEAEQFYQHRVMQFCQEERRRLARMVRRHRIQQILDMDDDFSHMGTTEDGLPPNVSESQDSGFSFNEDPADMMPEEAAGTSFTPTQHSYGSNVLDFQLPPVDDLAAGIWEGGEESQEFFATEV